MSGSAAALCIAAPPALAQRARIVIPATSLDAALTLIGRASGADIVSTEPGLGRIRVDGIDGAMSVREALARLLRRTGYHAVPIDGRSFRIVRDAPARSPRRVAAPPPSADPAPGRAVDVVVTASKQRVPLLRYPGSLQVIDHAAAARAAPASDLSSLAEGTPILQNTEFGPGRNKVFIRGIADSSFSGAAQSTASVYLDDVQIGYSGADPAIRLYDLQSVEVMEGPQGTLYGTGSIGGVVRLTPNPVDLGSTGGSIAGGVTLTRGGGPGFDVGGMLNLPFADDILGLRAVAYRSHDGGYIDDPARGLSNVNTVDTVGGRATLRLEPGDGWRFEVGGLAQRISAADAQYADLTDGHLARRATLAQPFSNTIELIRLAVRKEWPSGLQLASSTAMVWSRASDLFDATVMPAPGSPPSDDAPVVYQTDGSKLLVTHEMRLSRSLSNGTSWVAGFNVLRNREGQNRVYGPARDPTEIIGVTNVARSASAFVEATLALSHDFAATLGARVTLARTDGEPSIRPRAGDFLQGRSTRRVDPTLAFSWKLGEHVAAFGRLQTGYRTGGLAVARGIGRVADFRSDSIVVGELGLRRLKSGPRGFALSASASYARWTDIQADLVSRRGFPYTTNFGDAEIQALEGTADWSPLAGLRADLSFLYTHNRVTGPFADLSNPANRRLPETPPVAAAARLAYDWQLGGGAAAGIGGSASYTGRSVLGTGDLLDISQGRYVLLGAFATLKVGRTAGSLTIDNLADSRQNRFASGNPLTFAARFQTTPLRPFNVRLGLSRTF